MSKKSKLPKPKPRPVPVDPRSALRPSKPPDLNKHGLLAAIEAQPNVGFSLPTTSGLRAFTAPQHTTQQEELVRCRDALAQVWGKFPEMPALLAATMGLRRAYVMVSQAIHALCDEIRAEKGFAELPGSMADYVAQVAAFGASKPFDEHALIQSFVDVVMPTLGGIIDKHITADRAAAIKAQAEAAELRAATDVPIGLRYTPFQEGDALPRTRTLVLVGWENAVRWLLDRICEQLTEHTACTTVRLSRLKGKPKDPHARLIKLPQAAWAGCTNTMSTLQKLAVEYILPQLGAPVDLFVCDDLAAAYTAGFVGRPGAANAGDAHKKFRKWFDSLKAGFVAAIPLAGKDADTSGFEYENLRTFTDLRPVTVLDGAEFGRPTDYRVIVGNHATVLAVPKEILDACEESSLHV